MHLGSPVKSQLRGASCSANEDRRAASLPESGQGSRQEEIDPEVGATLERREVRPKDREEVALR